VFHQTEAKFQGWRALAVFDDGGECLLYVGRSTTQVRAGYAAAFAERLEEDERARVSRIALQCWQGAADQGRWLTKAVLAVPGRTPASATEAPSDLEAALLPFRRPAAAGAPDRPAGGARAAVGT
jgi:hypothetical protein